MLPARLAPLSLAVVMLSACSSAKETAAPPPDCTSCVTVGGGSNPPDPSGSGGSGGGGSGQGGGSVATVTGSIEAVNSVTFDTVAAYTKPAFVYADGLSGKQLATDYDGAAFTLAGVAAGDTWFRVGPKDATDKVFPTYSLQPIPNDKLVLPVLDQEALAAIAFQAGYTLSTLQAQIVLRVTDGKKPLVGVSADSAGAGAILYDFGADYSAQSTATSGRGVIVLLNQASSSIVLTDAANHMYQVDVRAEEGTATLLDLVL